MYNALLEINNKVLKTKNFKRVVLTALVLDVGVKLAKRYTEVPEKVSKYVERVYTVICLVDFTSNIISLTEKYRSRSK